MECNITGKGPRTTSGGSNRGLKHRSRNNNGKHSQISPRASGLVHVDMGSILFGVRTCNSGGVRAIPVPSRSVSLE